MKEALAEQGFENLLKEAVLQYTINESEGYPSQEEMDKLMVSEACDHKIRSMIKGYWRRRRVYQGLKIMQRTAAVIMMAAGISFFILLQFKEVRAACYNMLVQATKNNVWFHYSAPKENLENIKPEYIPEGFYITDEFKHPNMYTAIYENDNWDRIIFTYYKMGYSRLEREHYDISDITVNGSTGQYFSSKDGKDMNMLIWYDDTGFFRITSTLNKDEILKIAEHIK